MKVYKALFISCLVVMALLVFVSKAFAVTPTLYLSSNGGTDNVNINVVGDSNSSVTLYYNLNYSSLMQTRILGNTNNNGFLSTTINTNSYGIVPDGLVYVTVNNQQSSSSVWPLSYSTSSTLGLNISNITLPVGSSATFSSPNSSGLYVSSNSNSNIASALSSSLTSGCTLGSQYSVVTGQPCFNNYNSNYVAPYSYISGCTSGSQYSITTGQPCFNNYNSNYVAPYSYISGCTSGSQYSITTGQPCFNNNYNSTYNNNGSVVISALSAGSSTITLCQNNSGNTCSVVYVTVTGNYSNISSYSTSYIPSSAIVDPNYSTIPIIYSR